MVAAAATANAETRTRKAGLHRRFGDSAIGRNGQKGYQPGKLVTDGTCIVPMGGGEVVLGPPFEVLYATGGGRPTYPYPHPYPPVPVEPSAAGATASTVPA